MDLSPVKTTTAYADAKRWLASEHGTDSTFSVTLDLASVTFADHIKDFTDGNGRAWKKIASGTPVRSDGSTKYLASTSIIAAVDTQNDACAGHLFEDVLFQPGATVAGAAIQWHGVVDASEVPKPTGYTAAFDTAKGAKHVLYRA